MDKNNRMSFRSSPGVVFPKILEKEIIMITILINDSWADWSEGHAASDLPVRDISTATIGPPNKLQNMRKQPSPPDFLTWQPADSKSFFFNNNK